MGSGWGLCVCRGLVMDGFISNIYYSAALGLSCSARGPHCVMRDLSLQGRVPEVPVVSRGHLPQLEKIQEVVPSRRDEAHFG